MELTYPAGRIGKHFAVTHGESWQTTTMTKRSRPLGEKCVRWDANGCIFSTVGRPKSLFRFKRMFTQLRKRIERRAANFMLDLLQARGLYHGGMDYQLLLACRNGLFLSRIPSLKS